VENPLFYEVNNGTLFDDAKAKLSEIVGRTPELEDALQAGGTSPSSAEGLRRRAVRNKLRLDPAKVHPNDSGISHGHPVGALITAKAFMN